MACYPQAMPAAARFPFANPPLAQTLLAAAGVIAAVIGGRNLDRELAGVSVPLRPAVQDLAYGALRQYGRGDALLAQLLKKPLGEISIRALLLAAIYRLEARADEAHTTVDQAVTAAASIAQGRFKSLVNAVLRSFLRQHARLAERAAELEYARWQHPQWWVEKLRLAYPEQWQAILTSGNGRPPMALRINRRHIDSALGYVERLAQEGIAARALDDTAVLLDKPVSVADLPGFAAGEVSVQDWGAQQAAKLLDGRAGMRVLDACAAPGGKTAHILELADVEMLALDADVNRLRRVGENLDRLRLSAKLRVADCADIAAWWDGQPFARVLADVPCSASGVVRRHPDAKWLRRKADIARFARGQSRILDALWQLLAPGGKMLYCTCSLFPEENQQQMEAFVSRHPDAERLPTGKRQIEWQLIPCDEHDGFYYALMRKNA